LFLRRCEPPAQCCLRECNCMSKSLLDFYVEKRNRVTYRKNLFLWPSFRLRGSLGAQLLKLVFDDGYDFAAVGLVVRISSQTSSAMWQ